MNIRTDRASSLSWRRVALALALAALPACGGSAEAPAPPAPRTYVPEQGFQTVQSNGIDIAYFESGTGPLVILLHGFPATAHTWDAVRPSIAAAGYHVVAPFLPGYAPSGIPTTDTDMTALGHTVLGLVQALGETHAILVGHDWGAFAAYAAASFGPTQIDKIATLAIPDPIALFKYPNLPIPPHFKELSAPDAAATVQADDFAYLDALLVRWSPTWKVPAAETESVKNAFTYPGSLDAALGYYRTAFDAPPPQVLMPLPMAALTLYGTDDQAVSPMPFASQASAFTGPFDLVPLPVGHFVHREDQPDFLPKLLAFLAE